jgi:hypothetical protein
MYAQESACPGPEPSPARAHHASPVTHSRFSASLLPISCVTNRIESGSYPICTPPPPHSERPGDRCPKKSVTFREFCRHQLNGIMRLPYMHTPLPRLATQNPEPRTPNSASLELTATSP